MTIEEKIGDLLANSFPLGNAISEIEDFTLGGRKQQFENAILYETPEAESYEVHGAILGKYLELYEVDGELGFPASDELDDDVPGGKINFFDRGYISWTATGGAEMHLTAEDGAGTNDQTGLVEKLQQVADYAKEMLSLPLQQSKAAIAAAATSGKDPSWCGYTLAHLYDQAGAERKLLTSYFAGVIGLLAYGSYYKISYDPNSGELVSRTSPAKTPEIMDDEGLYVSVEEYHSGRNALRKIILFDEIQQEGPLDILPGDIVLFDHKGKAGPDHIQVVYEWLEEERLLIVIDGNGASFVRRITGANEAALSSSDISNDHIAKTEKLDTLNERLGLDLIYTYDGADGRYGMSMHRLTAANQVNTNGINSTSKHARIWAIIRPSLIDFEKHNYKNL